MFNKVVVANRGTIAARVLRALSKLGINSVAVYSQADAGLPYLTEADETYCIGPAEPKASYLNQDALIDVLKKSRALENFHERYSKAVNSWALFDSYHRPPKLIDWSNK
jgi:acetyl-CoA carboxylase biotin carboxylase subunit